MKKVELRLLADTIRSIASANPTTIYQPPSSYYIANSLQNNSTPACVYFDHGKPSCLIGHALDYLGYEQGNFIAIENTYDIEGLAGKLFREPDTEEENQIMNWLSDVQFKQDQGLPWGECV